SLPTSHLHSFYFHSSAIYPDPHSSPTRRSSDLSTSEGNTLIPLTLIISFVRARYVSAPCSSKRPVSPVSSQPSTTVFAVASGLPDRKSTRLNSSHVSISYAVFCLKKKIRNNSVQ